MIMVKICLPETSKLMPTIETGNYLIFAFSYL